MLFSARTKAHIVAALDAAMLELGDTSDWPALRRADATAKLIRQLLAAADGGERDHDRLVQAALDSIDRT